MSPARLTIVATLLSLELTVLPCAAQQWGPGGVRLCQNGCSGDIPRVVSDGAAGAFVAWRDFHNSDDVLLQRVTASGQIPPGWPAGGFPIAVDPAIQEFSSLAANGLGGALVAWEDNRYFPGTATDPFVQRVLADGSLPPGWVLNGNPASLAPGDQKNPQVAPDGLGGAYVVWEDYRDYATNGTDVYAQHMTASANAAPGWPGGGLAVAAMPGDQGGGFFVMPDDSGGAVFVWGDGRPGARGGYALRVHADGTVAAGWPPTGLQLDSEGERAAVRDDAGGFYVVSPTVNPTSGFDAVYHLRRFTFGGTPAPGWPVGGVLVCNAPGDRAGVTMDSDGAGGALLSWYDYRPPYDLTGGEIFALRVRPDGSLAPGWAVNGTLVSDPSNAKFEYAPFVVRDGLGGGYVAWQELGSSVDPGYPSAVQHLTGNGQAAAGWPQYGLRVAPSDDQFDTRITADGQGGAIVAWDERCCGRNGVWAQRFAPLGPTPVLISLVSAAVTDGRVQLDWFAAYAPGLSASVERRSEGSDWLVLGSATSDGTGHLRYDDSAVSAGIRYAYRLGYLENGVEQLSPETWVEVPALRLALEGLRPNPAVGELVASFALPSAAPARLQVLDVTGRVWLAREVGSLGAGNHLLRLSRDASVPAGMYWLRLTQSGRSLLARGVVVR